MSPKGRLIAFRLEEAVMARLDADRARYGTPVSEQIRRAVEMWLQAGGVAGATARDRVISKPDLADLPRP